MVYGFPNLHSTRTVPKLLINLLRAVAVGGGPQAPRLRYQGVSKNVPRIDVFVTACGEDVATIRPTIEGACASDYPSERFRVIVLDDGKSKKLKKLVSYMQCTENNLFYRSGEKKKDHNYKAGNLNDGLQHVASLPSGPAPFVAALDADMIAQPEWLRALLPHLLNDETVALAILPQVCTTQARTSAQVDR